MRRFGWIFSIACWLALGLASAPARADIYGYVDAQGAAHFAAEKLDARYQLFLRGDQAFDSENLTEPKNAAAAGGALKPISPALSRYLSQHPNLKKFESILQQAAQDYTIDVALLKAVMAAESGFNPAAVSPKGAIGLMQIMPATAERYGMQGDRKKTVAQKLADPKTNIRLAARYLRDLHKLFPNQLQLVLASYNAGEGAVKKYKGTIPPYRETRNYVRLVSQFYDLYSALAPIAQGSGLRVSSSGATSAKRVYLTIPGRRSASGMTGTTTE